MSFARTLSFRKSKKHALKIPKRNLLTDEKTYLQMEVLKMEPQIRKVLNDETLNLHCPPGIWYGYKNEWLEYCAESNGEVFIPGTLPNSGNYFYEVVVLKERFVDVDHYPDPYKVLKISSTRAFDKFTAKYLITEVPEEWLPWLEVEDFEFPLELAPQLGHTHRPKVKPRYINWKQVMRDFAGVEIKPRIKKREGLIPFKGKMIESWYDVWSTAGGVIWRPLSVIRLKLLYIRQDGVWGKYIPSDDSPPHRPAPRPPSLDNDPQLKDLFASHDTVYSEASEVSTEASSRFNSMDFSTDLEPDTPEDEESVEPTGTWPKLNFKKEKKRRHVSDVIQYMHQMRVDETEEEEEEIPEVVPEVEETQEQELYEEPAEVYIPEAPPVPTPETSNIPEAPPLTSVIPEAPPVPIQVPETPAVVEPEPEPEPEIQVIESKVEMDLSRLNVAYSRPLPPIPPPRTSSLQKKTLPRPRAPTPPSPPTPKRERAPSRHIAEAAAELKPPRADDIVHQSWPRQKGKIKPVAKPKKSKPLGSWAGEGKKKRIKVVPTLPKNFMEMLKKGEMPKEYDEWEKS